MNKLVYFVILIATCENARILVVFPSPLYSHQAVIEPLVRRLIEEHQVVLISGSSILPNEKKTNNLTEITLNLGYENRCNNKHSLIKRRKNAVTEHIGVLHEHIFWFDYHVRTEVRVQELLKKPNDTFDLLLLDANIRPLLVFSHIFKAPVILISTNGGTNLLYDTIGAPTHPLLYPTKLQQRINDLTKWERLVTCFEYFWFMYERARLETKENEMLRTVLGPEVPTLTELANNVDMLFLNAHPIWEKYRSTPPGLIYVWGIHLMPERALPEDIQRYLDASRNGVIYMSLGTNVKSCMLPKEWIRIFLRVFSKFPYNVLLKWDGDELPGKPDNVIIAKWFPQSDLLKHPKVKLFITQGGVQSTDEAIKAGVPLVGIPLKSDQWYQTEKYQELGIGVKVDPESLTDENFKKAIEEVMLDETYKHNIQDLRDLMEDQPGVTGVERAVWWIEYTLRHGGLSHLRAPAANISWSEYLQLKIILLLAITFSSILAIIIVASYYSFKFLKRLKSEKRKFE